MAEFTTDDGVTIDYDDTGPRDGVPVVLCHGLASSSVQHLADASYFAGRGYRVLVPDVRGHGISGKPRPLSLEAFSIPRMAADLVQMLDICGVGPVHWVGNSLGGILALHLLGTEAPRFRSLATFGTPYSLRLPRWFARAIPWAHHVFGAKTYARMAGWGMSRDPGAQELIASVVRDWSPEVGQLVAHHLTQFDLIQNAVRASVPILMIRGGQDPQINITHGRTLQALRGRPHFTLLDVPTGGHCANLDATEVVREALEGFWKKVDGESQQTRASLGDRRSVT
jgi:pimeloyl-ACP methyl ester carboxylesterase